MAYEDIEDIHVDTLFYTGWDVPALSCFLKMELVPLLDGPEYPATVTGPDRYSCTTRNGYICRTTEAEMIDIHGPDAPFRQFYRIPKSLNGDLQALAARLFNYWEYSDEGPVPPDDDMHGTRRLRNVPATVHYNMTRVAQRPPPPRPGVRETRLMTDVLYRIWVDWGFPYCLLAVDDEGNLDTGTRLIPFAIAGQGCRSCGQPARPRGGWNTSCIVRFVAPPPGTPRGNYGTELCYREGDEWRSRTINPPAARPSDPAWTRCRDGDPRPRLVLPNKGGFLLLQKLWWKMCTAYKKLNCYNHVRRHLQTHLHCLGELDHMLDMEGRMTPPDEQVERRWLGHAFTTISDLNQVAEGRVAELDRGFRLPRHREPFTYIHNFWKRDEDASVNPTFQWYWDNCWWHFPHFLGPITFMELAVWIMRQSPYHVQFFNKYGHDMFVPIRPGTSWEGDTNPATNFMAIDRRARQSPHTIPGVAPMTWVKQSVSVYAKVVELFTYHYASSFYGWHREGALALRARLGGTVSSFRYQPNMGQMSDFIQYVSGMDRAEVDRFVRNAMPPSQGGPGLAPATVRRRIQFLQRVGRLRIGPIGDVLDVILRTMKLLQFGLSVQENTAQWTPQHLADTANELFGLSTTARSLLGTGATQAGRLALRRATIYGAIFDSVLASGEALEAFTDRDSEAQVHRSMKAVGSYLCLAAIIAAGVPGAGWPVAITLGAMGTVLQYGAHVSEQAARAGLNNWRRRAEQLCTTLYTNIPPSADYPPLDRILDAGPFGTIRREYNQQMDVLEQRSGIGSALTLQGFVQRGDTWSVFPGARWGYLEQGNHAARSDFIRHCEQIDSRWRAPTNPRAPIPDPPLLPHDSPRPQPPSWEPPTRSPRVDPSAVRR